MLVLPQPIYKGQSELWETVVDAVVREISVYRAWYAGIDKVRLVVSAMHALNVRIECLGSIVSS